VLDKKEIMKFDELIEHYERAIGFNSTVKGVPMSEENLELCKRFVTDIHDCPRQDVRIMYRGPRTSTSNATLRKDARSFDVYYRPR